MIDQIKKLIDSDIDDIIRSPSLSLSLLSCYSKLYLNGSAPRVCESSQRAYLNQLKTSGMERAELMERIKERTCKPAFIGHRFHPVINKHIMPELLHDQIAIEYLLSGILHESDFLILPDGYKGKVIEQPTQPEEVEQVEQIEKPAQKVIKHRTKK